MLCVEDLSQLELFQHLPQERLHWVCDRAQTIALHAGEMLVQEGDAPRGLLILVAGQISVTRRIEASAIVVNADLGAIADGRFGRAISASIPRPPVDLRSLSAVTLTGVGTSGDHFGNRP